MSERPTVVAPNLSSRADRTRRPSIQPDLIHHDPKKCTTTPNRSRRWRRALGSGVAALAVSAVIVAVPGVAVAQTGSGGGFPGGGPVASGSVLSISGSTIDVQGSNGQADATVTVSDTTKYQKNQETPASAIVVGSCVRVTGKGNAKKGITAATIALSQATSDGCSQFPGGGGPGAGGAGGFPNGAPGAGGAGGFPNGGNGQAPNGNGNGNRPPSGGNRPRFNVGGTAFGTVKSVSGDQLVVKATTFSLPKNQNSAPKLKTQSVKVTLSSSTKVTETVDGVATDVAVGKCVVATGTGDSGAVSADNVRISDPQDGKCNAFGPGGPIV